MFLVRDELVEFGERAKVLDFGIAKFMSDDGGRKTTVGLILGTPIYMSPEQCEGRDQIGAKTDVYSLGVMLYELLAGEPPFRADGSAALMRKHMLMPPPPVVDKAPEVPEHIASLLMRMLAKEADDRPTMKDLVGGLAAFGPASARGRAPRSARWPRVVVPSVVTVAAIGAGVAFLLQSRSPSSPSVRPGELASTRAQGARPSASPSDAAVAPAATGSAPPSVPTDPASAKSTSPSASATSKKKRSASGRGHVGASPVEPLEPAKPDASPRAAVPPAAPEPPAEPTKDAAPVPRKRVYQPMR